MAIFRLQDRYSKQCRPAISLTRFHVSFNCIKDFYLPVQCFSSGRMVLIEFFLLKLTNRFTYLLITR